jgi:chromosome segregation ATPase
MTLNFSAVREIMTKAIASADARAKLSNAAMKTLSDDNQRLADALAKSEAKEKESAETIARLSDDCGVLRQTVDAMAEALANAEAEKVAALAEQAKTQAAELDEFSSSLAVEFGEHTELAEAISIANEMNETTSQMVAEANPTPFADAVAVAVIDSPIIDTPEIVAADQSIGTSTETPAEVTEAAIEAVVEAAAVATEAIEMADEIAAE